MVFSEIIGKVQNSPLPFRPDLHDAADRMPRKLIDVIKRGWDEEPDERPSASGMLKDIQRVNPSK